VPVLNCFAQASNWFLPSRQAALLLVLQVRALAQAAEERAPAVA
jgi:hypothetical protein